MCSDISILGGKIEDCAGQCTNGASCMNGECQCRKGFSGKFCEIIERVEPKTNYALYLKYFLFFIIITIIIILLLVGAYALFKKASEINAKRRAEAELLAQ